MAKTPSHFSVILPTAARDNLSEIQILSHHSLFWKSPSAHRTQLYSSEGIEPAAHCPSSCTSFHDLLCTLTSSLMKLLTFFPKYSTPYQGQCLCSCCFLCLMASFILVPHPFLARQKSLHPSEKCRSQGVTWGGFKLYLPNCTCCVPNPLQ